MTKNLDIETFYHRIKKSIEMVCVYLDDNRFKKLIINCRLKPLTIFNNSYKSNIFQTKWVDEFGNSMVLKNNEAELFFVDKEAEEVKSSTDLYRSKSILDFLENSKGIAFTLNHIIFNCEDEYFRCFNLKGEPESPLNIGIINLLRFIDYYNYNKDYNNEFTIFRLPNDKIKLMLEKEYKKI